MKNKDIQDIEQHGTSHKLSVWIELHLPCRHHLLSIIELNIIFALKIIQAKKTIQGHVQKLLPVQLMTKDDLGYSDSASLLLILQCEHYFKILVYWNSNSELCTTGSYVHVNNFIWDTTNKDMIYSGVKALKPAEKRRLQVLPNIHENYDYLLPMTWFKNENRKLK